MNTITTIIKKRGFTLIEMLIAVFIFTVAISALTFMAGRGIRSANDSQDRLTAEFLVLEGMEVVRNIRDSSFIASPAIASWNDVFPSISGPGACFNDIGDADQDKSCSFQYSPSGVPQLSSCNDCSLFLSNEGYNYEDGAPTPFVREIIINQINTSEVKVTTRVRWGNQEVQYQENLFLWR